MAVKTEARDVNYSNQSSTGNGSEKQYLTFTIGQEKYGIKLVDNKEVIRPPKITNVPNTADYVLGVINLRGQIVPVIDLKRKLGLSVGKSENKQTRRIIVVQLDEILAGIMVDSIDDVVNIADEKIEAIMESQKEISQEFIEGVFNDQESLVIIIDIRKILNGNKGKEGKSA